MNTKPGPAPKATLDRPSSPTCTYHHQLTSTTFKSGAGQLVLVLSHDRGFLNLVRVLLDELGYVAAAEEAPPCTSKVIARLQPALAIIEINYGYEPFTWALLRAVKEDPATASIPVIACAAAPWLLEHESVFFADNSICTWSEPFEPIQLLRTLDAALSATSAGTRSDVGSTITRVGCAARHVLADRGLTYA